ncbi:hypothetical protein OG883_42635 [Streptomyces sp. NBC_01142]|uniref:hypothetical protein n=1 Tax=Streptomyces sp. NBC_01142 TaxID=2975865 RepID=UPI002253A3F3|nr:hypothetical protein [Streptomyces sp. NBC_01142]MCX4826341.1 hypothetical protein [Streptomyces sp. NBC_01142]
MTLAELRRELAKVDHLPGDTIVILSKDAEGNGFSPLDEVDPSMYHAETEWSGEHYMTEEARQAQDRPNDYTKAPDDAVLAICLWPTN